MKINKNIVILLLIQILSEINCYQTNINQTGFSCDEEFISVETITCNYDSFPVLLRLSILEGYNLPDKDTIGKGSGVSDPYVITSIGKLYENVVSFKTKYIDEDVNPKWNEVYDVFFKIYYF